MRAVRYHEYGGPEVLRVEDVEVPPVPPGRIRIAVRAAGVNAADAKIRAGAFSGGKPLAKPAGTGIDAAGVVDAVGDGVDDVRIGDAVLGSGRGTWAEHAVLSDWVPLPEGLSFEEAAGWPVPVDTAVRMLAEADVASGGTVVVSGAAGGVGSAVVQIASARGLHVIGTASAANQAYLLELGVAPTTYDPGWPDRVRALAPDGVDAALDVAGAGVLPDLIALTGDAARVVSIADATAPELGGRFTSGGGDRRAALHEAVVLFERGVFRMAVEQALPLEHAAEAQRLSAGGHARGRTVLVP